MLSLVDNHLVVANCFYFSPAIICNFIITNCDDEVDPYVVTNCDDIVIFPFKLICQPNKNIFQGLPFIFIHQAFHCIISHNLAFIDDDHMVANRFYFLHNMR